MSSSAYKKRRRAVLFQQQGGLCHWCRREMVMVAPRNGRLPRNAATIDHLRDRFHPGRQEPARGEQRLVLACFKCNNDRGRASAAAQPKEAIWARSGRPPQAMRGSP